MAIYSLNHKHIGRKTQRRAFTAAAHIKYISRSAACTRLMAERMPDDAAKAQAWLREQERNDRVNARVVDKLMLALPKELDGQQRHALIRDFAEEVTRGRASWMAAFHDQGEDAHNPHCHLVLRDRDIDTGKRVMLTTERGSTDRLRVRWERAANLALERAGREERIDRRTLEAQGLERDADFHRGAVAERMEARGERPQSTERKIKRRAVRRAKTKQRDGQWRRVDYRKIDRGSTRAMGKDDDRELTPEERAQQAREEHAAKAFEHNQYDMSFDKDKPHQLHGHSGLMRRLPSRHDVEHTMRSEGLPQREAADKEAERLEERRKALQQEQARAEVDKGIAEGKSMDEILQERVDRERAARGDDDQRKRGRDNHDLSDDFDIDR